MYSKLFSRKWQAHLVVPLEALAGKDLLQIHTKHQESAIEKRRSQQAKFTSIRDIRPIVPPSNAPDTSATKPDPAEKVFPADSAHAADDGDESDGGSDSSQPADEAAIPADGGKSGDAEKASKEEPRPPTPGGKIEDEPPSGPEQNAFCDGCKVCALVYSGDTKRPYCSQPTTI